MADNIASLTVRAGLDVSDMVSGVNAASSVLRNFKKTQEDAFAPRITDVIGNELLKVNDQLKVQDNLFRNLGLSAVNSAGQAREAWSAMDAAFKAQAAARAAQDAQMQKGMMSARIQSIQNATAQETSLERSVALMRAENAKRAISEQQKVASAVESRFEAELGAMQKSAAIQKQLSANLGISTSQGRFDPRESAFNALPENFDKMSARAQRATYSIKSIGNQLGFTSGAASRFGLVAQQAGYQMQDFAVQVAGGQNKLVAFAQQGSQMLGVFGPTGAIAGAALAVGVLALQMMGLSENSKKAADEAERLRRVYQGLVDARKDLAESQEAPSDKRQRAAEELDKLAKREVFYKERVADLNRQMDAIAPIDRQTGDRNTFFPSPELNRLKKSLKQAEENAADIEKSKLVSQKELNKLDQAANDKLVSDNVTALKRELDKRLSAEDTVRANRKIEGQNLQEMYKRAETITDKLRPIEKMKREAEEIGKIPDRFLSPEDKRAAIDAMIKPTALPQALQVNAGASALGGTAGDGGPLLQIQQKMAADMHALLEAARAQLRLFAGV